MPSFLLLALFPLKRLCRHLVKRYEIFYTDNNMENTGTSTLSPHDALAILEWYADAGVDEVMEDVPVNYFAMAKEQAAAKKVPSPPAQKSVIPTLATPATPAALPPVQAAPPAYASQSTASIIASARETAAGCDTIPALQEAVKAFDGCALKKLATNTVFADGNPSASIMFIGEAPGAQEDKQGIPFCGDSGKLLDKMLAAIGLTREKNAYITNTIFWRPPGNRQPTQDELDICRPFVERHIQLMQPKLIVLVGGTAVKSVLQATTGITRLRGRPHTYQHEGLPAPIPVRAIFHPSYLLRQPAHKAMAWKDLLEIKQLLNSVSA